MRWGWPPWRRRINTAVEAHAALEQLEQRDAEVHDLGKKLKAAQRQNHFSVMVNEAIARTRES